MLVIRMRQQGTRDNTQFRVVVIDQRSRRDGSYVENLGWYNPHLPNDKDCKLNLERLHHWVSKGAQMTYCVRDLFKKATPAQASAPVVEVAEAPKKAAAKKTAAKKTK
jgi:small subunit ribosomal protein S16